MSEIRKQSIKLVLTISVTNTHYFVFTSTKHEDLLLEKFFLRGLVINYRRFGRAGSSIFRVVH